MNPEKNPSLLGRVSSYMDRPSDVLEIPSVPAGEDAAGVGDAQGIALHQHYAPVQGKRGDFVANSVPDDMAAAEQRLDLVSDYFRLKGLTHQKSQI
jgi:hypothetical protein